MLQFPLSIQKLLEKITKEEGLRNPEIQVKEGSSKCDGYVGVIKSIQLKGLSQEKEEKIFNLLIKQAQNNENFRKNFPLRKCYEREIHFYGEVLPVFETFLKEKGLEFPGFPKCYGTCEEEYEEALILEDLRFQGFRLPDRLRPFSKEEIEMVFRFFGKFHAISLALKDQKPEEYEELTGRMDDVFVDYVEESIELCTRQVLLAKKAFDERESIPLRQLDNFKQTVRAYFERNSLKECYPRSVIIHRDSWVNNFLFKYEGSNPTDLRLIDFQLTRTGSPILDLSYFFYSSAGDQLDNYKYYLKVYHDTLCDFLGKLGGEGEAIWSYEDLEGDWKNFSKFGLVIVFHILRLMLAQADKSKDMVEVVESGDRVIEDFNRQVCDEALYDERIRQIVFHFIENDLF